MDIYFAKAILEAQNRRLMKVNGMRLTHRGYEYRVRYEGNLIGCWAAIDRREVGKRNFRHFDLVDATRCRTAEDLTALIKKAIGM